MVNQATNKQTTFDEIIEQVGNAGYFQKRFTLLFVALFTSLIGLVYINKILSVAVPNHWCYVPGRVDTNYTLKEWTNMTIPIIDKNSISSYSKCTRHLNVLQEQNEVVKCDNGWEYDHTWYDMTASSQNNWVCDDKWIPINVIAVNRAAEMIGTIVFGQLADNYGRKTIFYISLIILLTGRIATIFTSKWVYIFMFFNFIGSLPNTSVYHSTCVIAVENSRADTRSYINMLSGYGWGLGVTISPLIMWWRRKWTEYCMITTIPLAIFLILWNWIIESPRWLASKGENKKCIIELKKIAKTNKTQLLGNIESELSRVNHKLVNTKFHSVLSIFSSMRLTKYIAILVYSVSTLSLIYFGLILNAGSLGGNPYLNYAFIGAVDLPVFFISKYSCDYFGRRWVAVVGFLITSLGSFTMAYLATGSSQTTLMVVLSILTKEVAAMTITGLYLQTAEICPTCIRQSSLALMSVFSNGFCIFGPYIVGLGLSVNIIIPYVLYGTCSLIGFVFCIFLPETLSYELPDTLEEAANFGVNQNFWGRVEKKYISVACNETALI